MRKQPAKAALESLLESTDDQVRLQAALALTRLAETGARRRAKAAAAKPKPNPWDSADFREAEAAALAKARQDAAGQKTPSPAPPAAPEPPILQPDATAPPPEPENPAPLRAASRDTPPLLPLGAVANPEGDGYTRVVEGCHVLPPSIPDYRLAMQPFDHSYNPPPTQIVPGELVGTYTVHDGWTTRDSETGEWKSERARLIEQIAEREREERERKLYGG